MKYNVSPLTCGGCIRSITRALQALDPAAKVDVDLAAGTVDADGAFSPDTVVAALAAIGYEASLHAAPARGGAGGCCGTCHS